MVWTFVKVALFFCLIAALALLSGALAANGGGIRLQAFNYEFVLGPVQSVVAILLALVAVWLVLRLLALLSALVRFFNGDENAISRFFDAGSDRKGLNALTDSMTALASGNGTEAMALAAKADRYLHQPHLTNLISAQAAELAGDRKKAAAVYRRLLDDPRTRFVGVRGLMKQKLDEGDRETALRLAEKAFQMQPANRDIQETLFQLQTAQGDWAGARKVLGAELKSGHMPRDVHRRRDALLALQEAKAVLSDDLSIEAREAALVANRQSPDLIPAAVMAAQGLAADGKAKQASRILIKAWEVQPHPDLAAAYAALKIDETPAQRLERFRPLFAAAPEAEETRLQRAELQIAAEDFPAARRTLGDLPETHPTARALTLMAAIERGAGADDSVVRGWLTRALSAPRGPQWVCDKCQQVNAAWSPVCDNCGGFDTLSWREPPGAARAPSPTDILPLIVGKPAEVSVAEKVEPVVPAPEPAVAEPEPEPVPEPEPPAPKAEKGAVYDAEFFEPAPGGRVKK